MRFYVKERKYTFIDLFAGCGGLSEGFYRKGFEALAHVEIDRDACKTLRSRMRHYGYKNADEEVIEYDITAEDIIERIECAVKGRDVDIIIEVHLVKPILQLAEFVMEKGWLTILGTFF